MTSKHLVPKWDRWDSDDEFDAEAAPPEPEEDLTAPPSAPWTDAESFPSMEDEEEPSEEDEEEPKPVQFIHVQHTGWHANHSHIFQEPQQSMQGDAQAASAGDLADTCRPEPQSAGDDDDDDDDNSQVGPTSGGMLHNQSSGTARLVRSHHGSWHSQASPFHKFT
jgi:hypothetical protein